MESRVLEEGRDGNRLRATAKITRGQVGATHYYDDLTQSLETRN